MIRPSFAPVIGIVGLLAVATQGPLVQPVSSQVLVRDAVDVSQLGPQVGQRAPDFRLKDQSGKTWTLQSIMGSRGAMLVFYRSADW